MGQIDINGTSQAHTFVLNDQKYRQFNQQIRKRSLRKREYSTFVLGWINSE